MPAAGTAKPTVVVPAGKPTVFLWPNGAPGSEARKDEAEGIKGETVVNVHNPSIIVFLPRKEVATGVGMIVAPGGGHSSLWIMHEGFNPAQALADRGIAAFVLKNRLKSSGYKFDVEGLADMQRAIKVVRSRAAEWGVDPNKIGASGFSAGGELAQVVALQHDLGKPDSPDPVERFSSRPDFQVLIYPGKSHLIQPVAGSPPAFMAAGYDDRPDLHRPCRGLSALQEGRRSGRAAHVRQNGPRLRPSPGARRAVASGVAGAPRLIPAAQRLHQVNQTRRLEDLEDAKQCKKPQTAHKSWRQEMPPSTSSI